jgi:hypothetical protein
MKRINSLIAITAALGFAGLAGAQTASPDPAMQPQAQPSEPMPSEEPMPAPTTPAAPSTAADPSIGSASTTSSSATGEPGTRLAAIAPSGMTTQEACTGFNSVSECVTALHVSQNLSIPFPELKAKVTGGQKLGAAVHELKPAADAKAEVRKAEEQTQSDLHAPQG